MQYGTLKSGIKFLKRHWGEQWIKQKTNSEIICTPSAMRYDSYDYKRKAGIEAIITFDDIMNVPQFPIIINKPFEVPICKGINLHGTFEYVREIEQKDKTKTIQLMKFRTENNRFQVDSHMHHDLELTAMTMAFKYMFNVEEFEVMYVDIYKKKIITSFRNQKDFDLLKETIRSVALCLKNNIRCISPDKRCYHCEYRNICKVNLE